jgi:hypothetical protein
MFLASSDLERGYFISYIQELFLVNNVYPSLRKMYQSFIQISFCGGGAASTLKPAPAAPPPFLRREVRWEAGAASHIL